MSKEDGERRVKQAISHLQCGVVREPAGGVPPVQRYSIVLGICQVRELIKWGLARQ